MRRQYKKPTRRKPDRPNKQRQYITYDQIFVTVDDYEPPWWTFVTGMLVALIPIALSLLLGFGRMQGWW